MTLHVSQAPQPVQYMIRDIFCAGLSSVTWESLLVLSQVVIMTQRSKLEMEGMFWRCLPESKRYRTKLVFRQGSPLVPSDLRLVGACRAAATIVVSDQSRSAAEADAQAVRYGGGTQIGVCAQLGSMRGTVLQSVSHVISTL